MKNRFFLVLFIFLIGYSSEAFSENTRSELLEYQDSLSHYFNLLIQTKNDLAKEKVNEKILENFRKSLKLDDSFDFKFGKLKHIGVLYSDDMKLRIITWNLPYNDGTQKYFGFIQYKKSKRKTELFELKDKSDSIKKPEYAVLDNENWYGALYYTIIENKYRGRVYYTLLASDLNDLFTKKKIVDILYFKHGKPVFGAPVFKNRETPVTRVILEYNAQVNMVLTYNKDKQMIVYDHLSPSKPSLKGSYEFYGPDFSYDGLKYERGIWNTYFDIDVRNRNVE